MSATTTTTSSTASAYAEGAIPAILVRGGGPTDSVAAVAAHEARTQDFTPATRPDGLRADREYPRQFDVENPEGWPQQRGTPHYRPLHANDAATRPMGATTPEVIFVSLMMHGVWWIGRVNQAWTATVGRSTKRAWVYPVGGEF